MGRWALLRFLVGHAAVGAAIALALVAVMLATDVANLRTLVFANDAGLLALSVMTVFFVITFASVQMGIAVMLKGDEPDTPARSFRIVPAPRQSLQPVPIRVRSRHRR